MRVRSTTDYSRIFLYLLFGFALLFLRYIGDNAEPFALSLFYAMASAGLSPTLSACLYLAVSLFELNLNDILMGLGQAFLIFLSLSHGSSLR